MHGYVHPCPLTDLRALIFFPHPYPWRRPWTRPVCWTDATVHGHLATQPALGYGRRDGYATRPSCQPDPAPRGHDNASRPFQPTGVNCRDVRRGKARRSSSPARPFASSLAMDTELSSGLLWGARYHPLRRHLAGTPHTPFAGPYARFCGAPTISIVGSFCSQYM